MFAKSMSAPGRPSTTRIPISVHVRSSGDDIVKVVIDFGDEDFDDRDAKGFVNLLDKVRERRAPGYLWGFIASSGVRYYLEE